MTLSRSLSASAFHGTQAVRRTSQVLRLFVVYAALQYLGLGKSQNGFPCLVVLVKDPRLRKVNADQGIAFDQPCAAAAFTLADQYIGDIDPHGDQMGQSLEAFDGGTLRQNGCGPRLGQDNAM